MILGIIDVSLISASISDGLKVGPHGMDLTPNTYGYVPVKAKIPKVLPVILVQSAKFHILLREGSGGTSHTEKRLHSLAQQRMTVSHTPCAG